MLRMFKYYCSGWENASTAPFASRAFTGLGILALLLLPALIGCGRRDAASQLTLEPREPIAVVVQLPQKDTPPTSGSVPINLTLDKKVVAQGDVLNGELSGDWDSTKTVLSLIWSDGLGRVVNSVLLEASVPPLKLEGPRKFSLEISGGLGRSHSLSIAGTPRNSFKEGGDVSWKILARVPFVVVSDDSALNGFTILLSDQSVGGAKGSAAMQALRTLGINGRMESHPPGLRGTSSSYELPVFVADGSSKSWHPFDKSNPQVASVFTQAFLQDRRVPQAKFSLFDGAAIDRSKSVLKRDVLKFSDSGAMAYSLGHQLSVTPDGRPLERLLHPETGRIFKAWLQKRYVNLESLNEQWGSRFTRWDQVQAPSTDEIKATYLPGYADWLTQILKGSSGEETPKGGEALFYRLPKTEARVYSGHAENFSAWCDLRAFHKFASTRILSEYRSAIRSWAPRLRVGLTQPWAPSAWGSHDWTRSFDWLVLGGHLVNSEMAAGFNPDLKRFRAVGGTGSAESEQILQGWMNGEDGLHWTPKKPLLNAAQKPTDYARKMAAAFGRLAKGLTMQRNAFIAHQDAVAIYYSPRSQAVHWILDSRSDGSDWPLRAGKRARKRNTMQKALEAWSVLLGDLGYAPTFVHPEELIRSNGSLKIKILILPKVICLGEREAQAIRNFTKKGGTVIADSECGLFDALGKRHALKKLPASVGTLDWEFGIARADYRAYERNGVFSGEPKAARVWLEAAMRPVPMGPSSPELKVNEPGLVRTGAWSFGRIASGNDAIFSRGGGSGRYIYLNIAMQDYPQLRARAQTSFKFHGMSAEQYNRSYGKPTGGEALRILVGDIMAEALGDAVISVRNLDGKTIRGVQRRIWLAPLTGEDREHSFASLIAILPSSDAVPWGTLDQKPQLPSRARLKFQRAAHWYDVQEGTYLGFGSQTEISLTSGRATVLAALDYQVSKIKGRVRRTDPNGGFKVALTVLGTGHTNDSEDVSDHVLHVEVFNPDGKHLPHYTRSLTAKQGQWAGAFILGQNEPPGRYVWVVRDVLTGVRTKIGFAKTRQRFGKLFSSHNVNNRWIPEVVAEDIAYSLKDEREAVLKIPIRLVPQGLGLGPEPELEVTPTAPWKLSGLGVSPVHESQWSGRSSNSSKVQTWQLELVASAADVKKGSAQKLTVGVTYGKEKEQFQLSLPVPQK